jgi:glucose/arabinose dehydrogenase
VLPLDPDNADDRGLLGLAFHPAYAENGRAFVFRTSPPDPGSDADHVNVVSELRALPDGSGLDPATERVLLEVPQRQAVHSGGQLLFDDGGALLVFLGDGGDRSVTAQDPQSLLGKVLRLDVDAPPGQAAPEVYASGLRHPWRVSYDAETDRVLIAEPAADRDQEVNILQAGANYGWDLEMPDGCLPSRGSTPPPACVRGPDGQELTLPAAEYERRLGHIVSGAHIYRGTAVPELAGKLVMSDLGQNTRTGQVIGAGSTSRTSTATRPGPSSGPRSPATRRPGCSGAWTPTPPASSTSWWWPARHLPQASAASTASSPPRACFQRQSRPR